MARLLAALLLGLAGLLGLGMSLCGGLFTVAGLAEKRSSNGGGEFSASSFLPLAVPSLLIGLAVLGFVGWLVFRPTRPPRDVAAPEQADDGR